MLRALLLASGIVVGLTTATAGGRSATPADAHTGVQKVVDDGAALARKLAAKDAPAADDTVAPGTPERAIEPAGSEGDDSGGCRSSGGERSHKVILLLALLLALCIRNRHR